MTNDLKIKDILLFFDVSPDILCIFGFDGTFRRLNPAFTRILGWSIDEAMQKPWLEFIHPDDLEKTVRAADELKQGIPKKSFRIKSMHKDGTYRLISWDSVSLENEELIVSVGRDVTELGQAEEFLSLTYHELEERIRERTSALNVVNEQLTREIERCAQIELELLERDARFQEAQKIAHIGSWDHDVATNKLTWSDEIFRIFEVDPDTFGASYEAFLEMIHPEDRESVDRAYISSLKNKKPYEITHRLKLQDGRIKYVHEKAQTFYDDSGLALRSVGTVQDITDQKRSEMSLAESEAKFRLVAETIQDVFWISSPGLTRLVYVSPAYAKVWGRSPESLYNAPERFLDAVHPDDYELARKMMTEFHAQGKPYSYEFRVVHPDGAVRWVFERGFPVRDDLGNVITICGVSADITQRKEIEKRLRDSERQYRLVVEKSSDAIWLLNPLTQKFTFVSESVRRIFGYDPEEALEINVIDWLLPKWRSQASDAIQLMIEGKLGHYVFECEVYHKDGRGICSEINASPWVDNESGHLFIAGSTRDITSRKEADRRLVESEANLRSILDSIPGVMMLLKRDGTILAANRGFLENNNVDQAACLGRSAFDFLPDEVKEKRLQWLEKIFTTGQSQELEDVREDRQIHTYGYPVMDENGMVDRVAIYAADVTELNKAAESSKLLAAVVEHGGDSVVVTDTHGVIKYVNPAFQRSSGYSQDEAVGAKPSILKSGLHDEVYYQNLWNTIGSGKVWKGRLVNKKKDGSFFEEDATISPMFNVRGEICDYVAVKRDVTKEVALQKQLLQSQKMEAIGTFAGGIAHDFNNIIFAIIGYTELALDSLPLDSDTRKDLVQVLKASSRAGDMVRQILAFSRQGDQDRKPCDIGPLIKEGVKFLRASIPTTIEIELTIDSHLGSISANPTQIHQVLLNLCANAAHSMRDSGGVLTLNLKQVQLGADFCRCHELDSPGQYIRFEVTDTGHGIPANIMQRVFEPYFTTKAVDEGTGMGLAVVHGIVRGHGGTLTVKSTPGVGTTFEIFFPVLESQSLPEEKSEGLETRSGTETILLVDDEQIIIEMESAILEHLGYKVVSTRSPQKAIEILEADPGSFDLVMTDLTMPKMTGIELVARIHRLQPDLPIILCTGYGHKLTEPQIKESGVAAVICKPIRKKDLAKTVRMALDGRK